MFSGSVVLLAVLSIVVVVIIIVDVAAAVAVVTVVVVAAAAATDVAVVIVVADISVAIASAVAVFVFVFIITQFAFHAPHTFSVETLARLVVLHGLLTACCAVHVCCRTGAHLTTQRACVTVTKTG